MKKGVIIAIIVIIVLAVLAVIFWPTITGDVTRKSWACEDSDAGEEDSTLVKGIVTLASLTGRSDKVYEDECYSSTKLREYRCERNYVKSGVVRCADSCVDGACAA